MEDFNLPSSERIVLLNSLQEAIGDVPPYFWASCQVCDLEALGKLVEHARISPAMVRIFATQTRALVLYWTQSLQGTSRNTTPNKSTINLSLGSSSTGSPLAKRQKTTDSPARSSLLLRSQRATALAKERDGFRCVLTGEPAVEVAHIYPFCRLRDSEEDIFGARHMFWDQLKNFWPEEKVAAWEAELFPQGLSESGAERVDNRITLSKLAHADWNRGAFALKPISMCNNNTVLKVQFFWQKKQKDIQPTTSLLTTPLSTEDLDCNEGAFDYGPTKLLGKDSERLKSGIILELKTDDPIQKPLPSYNLLELQWFLTRVVGMAGAAFPYEPTVEDDSEEDVPGLDEIGDSSLVSGISQSNSPEFLYKVNRLLVESSKHQTEEAEIGVTTQCMENV